MPRLQKSIYVNSMKIYIQISIKIIFDTIAIFFIFPATLISILYEKKSKKRVFLGLMSNNNLVYVADSLKKRGYHVQCIPWIIPDHERNVIKYDLDIKSLFPRMYANFFGQQLLIYGFFIWSLFNFDIYLMPFRNRLLDRTAYLKWFEFQLLHFANKIIILNPYGGDIHNPKVWENSQDKTQKLILKAWAMDSYYSKIKSKDVERNNRYCENHADKIIASVEYSDYLNRNNVIYLHMRCANVQKHPILPPKKNTIFKIFHATNHAHLKGVSFLEEAVNKINKDGQKCSLVILKNVHNTQVMNEMGKADIVFDQLLAGAYGRLAIEAMSLGKPVICYLRDDLKALYRPWKECPIINANIDNIKDKILYLMKMSAEDRTRIGQKSLEYVKKYHSPEYVGGILDGIIQKVTKDDTNR